MKRLKTFAYCEYCGKAWDVDSDDEKYENGFIEIKHPTDSHVATLFIPAIARESEHDCCMWFDGVYCNVNCLTQFLLKQLESKCAN